MFGCPSALSAVTLGLQNRLKHMSLWNMDRLHYVLANASRMHSLVCKLVNSCRFLCRLICVMLYLGGCVRSASLSAAQAGDTAEQQPGSISSMTTAEWRDTYEKDGYVDLWVEEEFNAGSRLMVGNWANF